MRRALVLTDESARHPLRALIPAVNRRTAISGRTPLGRAPIADTIQDKAASGWRITRDDVRGFANAYFATFAAVMVFLL